MAQFRSIRVTRKSPDRWDYHIEITDDAGRVVSLDAGIEDLDRISAAVDETLDEMVEAAERLAMAQ